MNFSKIKMNQLLSALLIATMFVTSFATLASAQEATSETPTAEATAAAPTMLRAKQVTGSLPGGTFAKIWLELQPESVGAQVTLVADFSTDTPLQAGAGFFVLDSNNFVNVLGGGKLIDNNVAAGNPSSTSQANQLEVSFNADSTSNYTVVVVNDGANALSFTLTATNATVIDGSGQVRDPNAAAAPTAAPTEAVTAAPTEATPEATVATTETTTATVSATATPAPTTAAATTAPSAVLRAATVEGQLPKQYDQHFLGLEPSQRDSAIDLSLTIDPQDNSEVLRKVSFLVLDENGFKRYLNGESATSVAIAAGNRVFDGPSNLRVASFNAVGNAPMTVIVYNNSEVAASYTLTAKGATIVDDSGQTLTAQQAAPVSGSTAVTSTTAATTTTAAATATTSASTITTTTQTSSAGAPAIGSSYTIKSGDSISKIARDVYGDIQLYDELCAYNKVANCDAIEVGDVIQLPARNLLGTGATTSAQPTPAPTKAPAATVTVTATQSTTSTTPAVTAPVTRTTTVTETTPVTSTSTTTSTAAAPATSATTSTTTSSAGTIMDIATANSNFSILVDLLKAAGLDTNLNSDGSYTVFAPTNAAFEALPAGAIDQLKRNPQGQLKQILLFHVLPNAVTTSELKDGMEATTLQGGTVKFQVQGSQIKVQDSIISPANVEASNGVIQIVDKVMLPPAQ